MSQSYDGRSKADMVAGTHLGKRELRALVANPRLQVQEDRNFS